MHVVAINAVSVLRSFKLIIQLCCVHVDDQGAGNGYTDTLGFHFLAKDQSHSLMESRQS